MVRNLPSKRFFASLEGTSQHLGDGNAGHCETQAPCRLRGKERRIARAKSRVRFHDVNDGGGIEQQHCLIRKVLEF